MGFDFTKENTYMSVGTDIRSDDRIKAINEQGDILMLARILTLAAVVMLLTGAAFADTTNVATAHVYVLVNPNIAVGVITPNVDLFTIQTGIFPGQIIFRVDANAEQVWLSVGPTFLYKGNDPNNTQVAPIVLAQDLGALIEPTNAYPIAGGTNVGEYMYSLNHNGFVGMQTNYIAFESSQPGYFSQDVFVTIWWNQDNPEKPQGEYSGFVTLYATIVAL
jgi:hypothetical protein